MLAETSDNLEVGIRTSFERASFGLTAFSNWYDNFIELTQLGFNPMTRLLEFQSQNLEEAEIQGIELRGEAYLTDNLMLRGSYARIEGAEILKDAAVAPIATQTPLGSIAPDEGVVGIRYAPPSNRWGGELSIRLVESYQGAPGENQFAPQAYHVVDLVGFVSLADDLRLRLGALNLTNNTYFEWWNVRGRLANDPVIDRYSSPGLSVIGSLAYDW